MRSYLRTILFCLLLVLVSCSPRNQTADPTFVLPTTPTPLWEGGSLPWSVVSTTKGDLTATVESHGDFVPKVEQPLFFTISGLVKNVFVNPGDKINAGEPIAELDTRFLDEQLVIRESELAIANMEVLHLESQLPADVTADDEGPKYYALEIAKIRAQLAEARFQHSQQQLDSSSLKAPFTGSVSSLSLQPGENVLAYETVGMIADTSELSVQVMIPSTDIDFIKKGSAAELSTAGHIYAGKVTLIDLNATLWQGESAHKVIINFESELDLSSSIYNTVDAKIYGETRENVLMVPLEAVDILPGQAYVDKVVGDKLHRTPVEVGITDGINIEIQSGLEEGSSVALP